MGKRSKAARKSTTAKNSSSSNSGTTLSVPSMAALSVMARRSTKMLDEALDASSRERLRELYKDPVSPLLTAMGSPSLVTDADVQRDPQAAHRTMKSQIKTLPLGPIINKSYQTIMVQQLKSMGGLKNTFVQGKYSFYYSCGFTSVGGKELFIQDLHKSMGKSYVYEMFNFLYQRHQQGHPLDDGHTIQHGNMAYLVKAMDDSVESTLIKVSKTLEPTRMYGIAGYDLLELIPVAIKTDKKETSLTHEEILMMTVFPDWNIKGFQSLQGKAKKLETCAACHATRDTATDTPLQKCTGCRQAYYCNGECQAAHWSVHKPICKGTVPRDSFANFMKPFMEHFGG